MILIFDTSCGLCNQLLDIQSAISFCNQNKLNFTFRNCSLRNTKNLKLFFKQPFNKLFDDKLFYTFDNYEKYSLIEKNININNTYNLIKEKRSIELFKSENELLNFIENNNNYEYIILPQFFAISDFSKQPKKYYIKIKPNPKLFSIFMNLKKHLLPNKYNFIHFRYEDDFTSYFKIKHIQSIDSLLRNLDFKDKTLKTYIACSNLKKLSKTAYLTNDIYSYKNIVFKDDRFQEYNIHHLNFEEKAFIDLLIGVNSEEIYGHSKSSFSSMLNMFKNTNNYYDVF